MRIITYNNINSSFTFENVCLILTKFWTNEVLVSNKLKIWLSITVYKKNKSIILIDNLPFNTCDYTDLVVVLQQNFVANIKKNKKSMLDKIVFSFHFENKHDRITYSIYLIMFMLYIIFLICSTFLIFYGASEIFNIIEIISNNNILHILWIFQLAQRS